MTAITNERHTILLSAGHHPHDPGASIWGLQENKLTPLITFAVATKLTMWDEMSAVPLDVKLAPWGSLASKITWVNHVTRHANPGKLLAVEFHMNVFHDPTVRGMEVFVWRDNRNAWRIADALLDTVEKHIPGIEIRGVKDHESSARPSLGWITKTRPTALLVECGFLSNSRDRERFSDPVQLNSFARAVAIGLEIGIKDN